MFLTTGLIGIATDRNRISRIREQEAV